MTTATLRALISFAIFFGLFTWPVPASSAQTIASQQSQAPALGENSAPTSAVYKETVAKKLKAKKGGTVSWGSGQVSIVVPPKVMKRDGKVAIREVFPGVYDIHISPKWKGFVTVRLPLAAEGLPLVGHKVKGSWRFEEAWIEGDRAVARVNSLSLFSAFIECAKTFKKVRGPKSALASAITCLLDKGVDRKKLLPDLVNRVLDQMMPSAWDPCRPISWAALTLEWWEILISSCHAGETDVSTPQPPNDGGGTVTTQPTTAPPIITQPATAPPVVVQPTTAPPVVTQPAPTPTVAISNNNGQMVVQLANFPTGAAHFFCHAGSGWPTGGSITNHGPVAITSPNQSWSSGWCSGSGNFWVGIQAPNGSDYYSNQVTLSADAPASIITVNTCATDGNCDRWNPIWIHADPAASSRIADAYRGQQYTARCWASGRQLTDGNNSTTVDDAVQFTSSLWYGIDFNGGRGYVPAVWTTKRDDHLQLPAC